MNESFGALRLDHFLERLSSADPTPGGGSASALAGATGAALLHMVLALTTAGDERLTEADLAELRGAAVTWQSELLALVDRDAAAYDAVVAARRLPRGDEREREARRTQLHGATREATRIPLDIGRRAASVLDLAHQVAAIGNRNAISDVGVAALLAEAALRGAVYNVRINLPSLPDDEPLRVQAAAEVDRLLADLDARTTAVRDIVEERMT